MAFPYPGGQRLLLPYLLNLIPSHKVYVEVFGGSGTLLLNKRRSKMEIFNEINPNIVNLLLVIRDYPRKFRYKIRNTPYSRWVYNDAMKNYNPSKIGKDITSAVKFYFLICSSYGGRIGAGMQISNTGVRTINRTWVKRSEFVRNLTNRLAGVAIECLDFKDVIDRYDSEDAFLFCDPPYYGKETYYSGVFEKSDHCALLKLLKKVDGKFLLTYNKHKAIKRSYRDFYILEQTLHTSLDMKTDKRQERVHYLIANYDIIDENYSMFVPDEYYEV